MSGSGEGLSSNPALDSPEPADRRSNYLNKSQHETVRGQHCSIKIAVWRENTFCFFSKLYQIL